MNEHPNRNGSPLGLIAVVLAFVALTLIAASRMPGMALVWDGHPVWSEGWMSWVWIWVFVWLVAMILIPISIASWLTSRAGLSRSDAVPPSAADSYVCDDVSDEKADARRRELPGT